MERRDLLKDQIEQFGPALGSIIANFFQLKAKGKTAQGIEVANKQLNSQLDLDITFILMGELDELQAYFKKRKVTAQHIEDLVDFIVAIAESKMDHAPDHAIEIFERALALYAMATRSSKIYPFARIEKEQHIHSQLKRLYADS